MIKNKNTFEALILSPDIISDIINTHQLALGGDKHSPNENKTHLINLLNFT